MEETNSELLQSEFEATAAPAPPRVRVTLDLDADLLEWLKGQPRDWQTEINTTMRFFMETSNAAHRLRGGFRPGMNLIP